MIVSKKTIIALLFGIISIHADCQYIQFYQNNISQQRSNPATVASSNYAQISFLHRNQNTNTDVKLSTSYMSAKYPLIKPNKGKRWSGLGITTMVDKSGIGGLYEVNELTANYALNVLLAKNQSLSFGISSTYHTGQLAIDKLTTGNQYVSGQGFLKDIPTGENFDSFNKNYLAFGTGIYWNNVDRDNIRKGHFGLSIFDFNRPNESLIGNSFNKSSTLIIEGGLQLLDGRLYAIYPEFSWTNYLGNNDVTLGTTFSYFINQYTKTRVLNFIAKYDFTKVGVLAIQYQMENLLIGGSYDLPFINNVAHHGAFEIGAKYQKLVKSKRKFKKRRKKRGKYKIPPHVLRHRKNQSENVTDLIDSTDSTFIENFVSDDIPANVDNDIPFSINKKIAFKFEFNKSTISPETEKYILNTIEFMTENELTHIIITGHTDNIGSSKYNLKLSKQRAETIARLLVSEGNIDADRIIIDGKGDTEPLNQNFNELDRELNRRVELYFFYDK